MSNIQYDFLSQSGVSPDKQMVQLSQRRDKLLPKLEKLLCRVQTPGYLSKVPAHVRQQLDTKVSIGQSAVGELLWFIYS